MQTVSMIWDFIQNQVLGMKWLNALIGEGLSAAGLDTANRWVGSLQFFLYDVIKIVTLLCTLIFLISYVRRLTAACSCSSSSPVRSPMCWILSHRRAIADW